MSAQAQLVCRHDVASRPEKRLLTALCRPCECCRGPPRMQSATGSLSSFLPDPFAELDADPQMKHGNIVPLHYLVQSLQADQKKD